MPVDLIDEPRTFARRVVAAMKAKKAAQETRESEAAIVQGLMPPPPPAPMRRAQLPEDEKTLEDEGNFSMMIEVAQDHQTLVPTDANGPFFEGRARYLNGDFAGAVAAWEKTRALNSRFKNIDAQLEKARSLQKRWGAQPPPRVVESDVTRELAAQERAARALLNAQNYDAIEARVEALTRSKPMTASGDWLLNSFFSELTRPAQGRDYEAAWDETQHQIEAWRAARPRSWLARVALAKVWINRAGYARGSAWAKDVKPSEWKLMQERINRMGALLDEGGDLKKQLARSPLFCDVVQSWALYSDLDNATYDDLVSVTTRQFPTYWRAYERAAYRLTPRWHGEPGDWELYAKSVADREGKIGGAASGDALYARIVTAMLLMQGDENIWVASDADWPRTKRGSEAMLTAHPDSLGVQSVLFELAYQAEDWTCAQAILKVLDGRVNRAYYGGNARDFALHRIAVLESSLN